MNNSSDYLEKTACRDCGSSDACAVYTDGHSHCFSCGVHHRSHDAPSKKKDGCKASDFISGTYEPLTKRKITEATCRKLGYLVGIDGSGKHVQIAEYFDKDGERVAQKIRYPDKTFRVLGDLKSATLFGQTKWAAGGKRVVVTEGEIDALSVCQAFNDSWPVVSIPSGAQSARKALSRSIEWLESFAEVVLMFDNDEPGRAAASECASLFSPGRCKLATLPRKDANECLQHGEVKAITQGVYQARNYRPDGLVTLAEIEDRVLKPTETGRAWWDGRLTAATYGRRFGEVYLLGAGTGVGKTDFLTQQIAFDLQQGWRCGVLFLEQGVAETARRIAGKMVGKIFHVAPSQETTSDLEAAWGKLKTLPLDLYENFGAMDWGNIKGRIRFMVQSLGCEHIYLDHLTALAAAEEDERKGLERIMAEAAALANELHFTFHIVSHLSTPDGKPHEEGGRVMIRHFKGSRAIGYWAHAMFGLERDQQDESQRNRSVLRCLKDRFTGRATGRTFPYEYDQENGLLTPIDKCIGENYGFTASEDF